jgi:hypothetical protein
MGGPVGSTGRLESVGRPERCHRGRVRSTRLHGRTREMLAPRIERPAASDALYRGPGLHGARSGHGVTVVAGMGVSSHMEGLRGIRD